MGCKGCMDLGKRRSFSESLAYFIGALEVPLHTQARANLCSIGAAEVIGNLYLTTRLRFSQPKC